MAGPAGPTGRGWSMPGWLRGVCGVVLFVLAAEAFGRADVINRAVLPLASTVLARAAGLAVSGRFLADVAATIGAWALGLAIAVAVAVPAGVVLGSLPGVRAATRAMSARSSPRRTPAPGTPRSCSRPRCGPGCWAWPRMRP